ncbi:efflux transporter outer membrane subunit [Brenneria populi]|uniref:Efflux transporter outer membrane subunit n=1 Tax=Brenneria populi TaxID=1505588 RepID=A0ABU6JQY3_9GAMM|nr:efflux transporter outer membrane subunit [Brenneria populi Li et al. 2015]
MNRVIRSLTLPAAVTLLALSIGGCVTSPDRKNPRLPSLEAATRARAYAVKTQPGLTDRAFPSEWWTLFGDSTLTELERAASSANLDLLAAVARIDESRAQLGLADAARRPRLSADIGYARSAISEHSPNALLGAPTEPSSTWTLGLQAGWELDLWGHLRHQSEAASARLWATAYGMEGVRVSVAGDVARTYLLLRGTQAQIRIVDDNRQIALNLARLTESRRRNGVATRYDAAAARADVAGIEARLAQLGQQRDALMNALALLLGKPPRELNTTLGNAAMPPMPARLPVGVPSELARHRPDILQADARLRAAVADIGAAEADFYPRISLTGNIGVQAFEFSDLGSWRSRDFSVGPTLYLPIFQGGRLRSNLELSEARHRLAGIAYQQTVLRAWHEVDDALNAYAAELKRRQQLQLAVDQNRTALEVANRGYQQGTADFTSVLVARRTLLASQSELTDCITAAALSVVSLYRALGGGWSPALRAAATAGTAS